MLWTRQWWCGTLAFPLLAAHAAGAQSSEISALQQQITTLKQTVEQLTARVAAVERQLPPPAAGPAATAGAVNPPTSAPTSTPSHEAELQDRWAQLSHGMTLAETEALLGRPDRTLQLENKTVWFYTYAGIGNGSVVFDADGSVTDWQNPPFRQWW